MAVFQQKYIFSNSTKLLPKEGCWIYRATYYCARSYIRKVETSIGVELQAKKAIGTEAEHF